MPQSSRTLSRGPWLPSRALWSFLAGGSLHLGASILFWVFPDSSVGEESTCSAGDPGLIPGSGRSAGEGIGHPPQCSWASLLAQLVKNLPAMQETWVRSLGWEDPLEKRKATHSSVLAWRIPWTLKTVGLQRVGHDWATFTFFSLSFSLFYTLFTDQDPCFPDLPTIAEIVHYGSAFPSWNISSVILPCHAALIFFIIIIWLLSLGLFFNRRQTFGVCAVFQSFL